MEESSLTSSNLIPSLPNHITFQILFRLPLKTLVRFSCLSNSWHSLIFSNQHNFARSHLQHQAPSPRKVWMQDASKRMCCNDIPDSVSEHLEDVDPVTMLRGCRLGSVNLCFSLRDKLLLVGCCDGVFCFLKTCTCGSDSKIYLWNPALRQCIWLPRRIGVRNYDTMAVAFGFDSFSQDYIVAKVQNAKVAPEDRTINRVDIYRLNTHSWTTIRSAILDGRVSVSRASRCASIEVIHNGYLYWLAPEDEEDNLSVKYIHATIADDEHHFVVPDFVKIPSCQLTLYKGRLSICGFTFRAFNFELWQIPEAAAGPNVGNNTNINNLWVKLFVVPQRLGLQIRHRETNITAGGRIMAFDNAHTRYERGPYGEEQSCGRLILYNPETQRVESVKDGVSDFLGISYFVADNYVESLVSVRPTQEIRCPRIKKKKKKKSIWRKLFCSICDSMPPSLASI